MLYNKRQNCPVSWQFYKQYVTWSSKRSLRLLKDLKEEQKYALTEWEKNGADVYIAIPCDLVGIFPSKKGDCNYAYYVCLEKLDDSLLGMHDAYTLEYIISKMQS